MHTDAPSFWSALADTEERQHRFLNTVGFAVSLFALLAFVPLSYLFHGLGIDPLVLSLAGGSAAWFALMRFTIQRPWVRFLDETVALVAVSAIPAVLVYWISTRQSPTVGFGSFTAAQIGMLIIAASGLSFRVRQPTLCALAVAVTYAIMWSLMRAELPQSGPGSDLWGARVTGFRLVSFLLWGALWSGLIWALRRSISAAMAKARERDLFGKYRLGETIASGGMGTVCRATYCPEGGFAREVAVKRIHPHLATSPAIVDRFRREAEIGARLHHPNIVATLDFGRVEDTYFVAMEYVDGMSLRTAMRRASRLNLPIPTRIVAGLGRDLCRALSFAHSGASDADGNRLRVVHDDICPANVLLTRGGVPKLADFGVARALRDATRHHTENVVGKVGYLAPEQILGEPFDARADLFSLAAVLWEALTGRRLFKRHDIGSSLHAIVSGDVPDLRELRPELGLEWKLFFDRALAVSPTARFTTAEEMADELASLLGAPLADDELSSWLASLADDETLDDDEPAGEESVGATLTTPAPPRDPYTTLLDETPAWMVEQRRRAA